MSDGGLEPTKERVLLALGLGLACMVGGGYLTYDAVGATATAEEVDAVVKDSHVSRVSGAERKYRVRVTYEYTYGGENYTSDNVFAGTTDADRFSNRGSAESFMGSYPEGETVTAHIDPDDPSRAHLESGIRLRSLVGYAVLILIGVVTFAGGVKQLRALSSVDQ